MPGCQCLEVTRQTTVHQGQGRGRVRCSPGKQSPQGLALSEQACRSAGQGVVPRASGQGKEQEMVTETCAWTRELVVVGQALAISAGRADRPPNTWDNWDLRPETTRTRVL